MAALANKRHEQFCWEYIKSRNNGKQAYLAVYGQVRGAAQSAVNLLRRPDIKARLQEIRAATAERNEVSVDSLVAELDEMIALAKADPKQYSSAVNAITAKAKISGCWVDRVQVSTESMSDEELIKALETDNPGSVVNFTEALKKSKGGVPAASRSNGMGQQPPSAPTET